MPSLDLKNNSRLKGLEDMHGESEKIFINFPFSEIFVAQKPTKSGDC
jgi:hypothetical protein